MRNIRTELDYMKHAARCVHAAHVHNDVMGRRMFNAIVQMDEWDPAPVTALLKEMCDEGE